MKLCKRFKQLFIELTKCSSETGASGEMQVSATFLSIVLALLATCLELRNPINSFTY